MKRGLVFSLATLLILAIIGLRIWWFLYNADLVLDVPGLDLASRPDASPSLGPNERRDKVQEDKMEEITVKINGKNYSLELSDSVAAQALMAKLPLELEMSELNGNEKYAYLDWTLPTAVERPGQIKAGDVMLYGDDCLVIFYKGFQSNYSYTRVGWISGLGDLGAGEILVTFAAN